MPKTKKSTKPATKPTSLVTFLLDRSGSMRSCKAATIEAFNGYIEGLQQETEAVINFTFLQFDSVSLDKVCVAIPVKDAVPLNRESYCPRGSTPLIDAAMKTIRAVEISLVSRDDKPKVVVCIQTDGEENCSTEYGWEELRALITKKTEEGWQFNFMGAGIDAYQQATRMGVAAMGTMSYDSRDLRSTRAAFTASAANTRAYAVGASANTYYSASQRSASGDKFADKHMGVGHITFPRASSTLRQAMAADLDLTKPTRTARRKAVPDLDLK